MELFDAFSQGDSSNTRMYEGTGLGLATAKQLVSLMDGEIGVDSATGVGSTFWFALTLEIVSERDEVELPRLDGLRVLAVDDNPTNRLVLGDLLRGWGAHVDTASGGTAALEMLAGNTSYDLAVLDMMMPVMNGLDLATRINDSGSRGPRLVLLTSDPSVDQGRAANAGFSATLSKPVRSAQLRTVLAELACPSVPESGPHAAGRILVVDDNQTNQLITSGMVEYLGYHASVAADEVEALIALARVRYDAVLIDCRLPVRGELRTAQEIRRFHGAETRVPIIAMTATDNDDHLDRPPRGRHRRPPDEADRPRLALDRARPLGERTRDPLIGSAGQRLGSGREVVDAPGELAGAVGRQVEVEAEEGRVDERDDPGDPASRSPAADEVVAQRTRPLLVAGTGVRAVGLLPDQAAGGSLAVERQQRAQRLVPVGAPQPVDGRPHGRCARERVHLGDGSASGVGDDLRDQRVAAVEVVDQHPVAGPDRRRQRAQRQPDQALVEHVVGDLLEQLLSTIHALSVASATVGGV